VSTGDLGWEWRCSELHLFGFHSPGKRQIVFDVATALLVKMGGPGDQEISITPNLNDTFS